MLLLMVERKFLSWRIKVKVRKKGFRMQRYIFEIRKGKKILGYEIKIGEMGSKKIKNKEWENGKKNKRDN